MVVLCFVNVSDFRRTKHNIGNSITCILRLNYKGLRKLSSRLGLLVILGLMDLLGSISVYIGLPPREREKEERKCPNRL